MATSTNGSKTLTIPTLSMESVVAINELLQQVNIPVTAPEFETVAMTWARLKTELSAIEKYHAGT